MQLIQIFFCEDEGESGFDDGDASTDDGNPYGSHHWMLKSLQNVGADIKVYKIHADLFKLLKHI